MPVLVKYKDEDTYQTREFGSWDEEGNYTLLYKGVSLDGLSMLVPTANIVSITILKEIESEKPSKKNLESLKSLGAYTPRLEY